MIEAAGYAPVVIEYLETGWSRGQLKILMDEAGVRPRDFLREKGTPAAELGLLGEDVADSRIVEAMIAHPILVNRPIVVTPIGVRLCRPSELAYDLLDKAPAVFTKEDGQIVRADRA
jgi:arsenate reductase